MVPSCNVDKSWGVEEVDGESLIGPAEGNVMTVTFFNDLHMTITCGKIHHEADEANLKSTTYKIKCKRYSG